MAVFEKVKSDQFQSTLLQEERRTVLKTGQ